MEKDGYSDAAIYPDRNQLVMYTALKFSREMLRASSGYGSPHLSMLFEAPMSYITHFSIKNIEQNYLETN